MIYRETIVCVCILWSSLWMHEKCAQSWCLSIVFVLKILTERASSCRHQHFVLQCSQALWRIRTLEWLVRQSSEHQYRGLAWVDPDILSPTVVNRVIQFGSFWRDFQCIYKRWSEHLAPGLHSSTESSAEDSNTREMNPKQNRVPIRLKMGMAIGLRIMVMWWRWSHTTMADNAVIRQR